MRRRFKKNWASIIRRHSGFTLIELTVAIIVLSILIAIAFSFYSIYVNKAKLAIAESVLDSARDNLEAYYTDNAKYPTSIDWTDCMDESGHMVFPPSFCNQLRKDLASIESYTSDTSKTFELKARATDTKNTLIILTPNKITTQGN
jgi:prepilin-type N-terminal cleavage/methylation domain-containing protein